jgi:hypothetical protein
MSAPEQQDPKQFASSAQIAAISAKQRLHQFQVLQQGQIPNPNLEGDQMGDQMAPQMALQSQRQLQSQIPKEMVDFLPRTTGPATDPQSGSFNATSYDGIPITEPNDLTYLGGPASSDPEFILFISACKVGDLSIVKSTVNFQPRKPAFLHQGLLAALYNAKIDVARFLLEVKAPITRIVPTSIRGSTAEQISLFKLLEEHGWTVNTPGFYGAVLLPSIIQTNDDTLIHWFLSHGADPKLGEQRDTHDRFGGPETNSCQALEVAAVHCNVQIVQKLLDAGAEIGNGVLYLTAGACPQGSHPHEAPVTPSKEFDEARIPVMELLVERGADVNGKYTSRYMTAQYPIVNAVMAGAIERVKWLLRNGANPNLEGPYGSARDYARRSGTDEMKRLFME